jgi:hypothetical protein
MSYSKSSLSDREYRDAMDPLMEDLAVALWGVGDVGPKGLLDHQIVEQAAKKIELLRAMIVATGFNEKLLQTIMES